MCSFCETPMSSVSVLVFILSDLVKFAKMQNDSPELKTHPITNATLEHCLCVPYWQCKEDFSGLIEDGINVIDIRITKPTGGETCTGDFDVCCQIECGRSSNFESTSFRILGGKDEAHFGEFPWMLGIIQDNMFLCGGSLIHPQVAITAAHCVSNKGLYVVRAGEWSWATKGEVLEFQERKSQKIIIHPKYHPESLENDVAMIIFALPFRLTESIGVICLPTRPSELNDQCVVSGWGKSSRLGPYRSTLKKVSLPIVPRGKCSKTLGAARLGPLFRLHESFVCAGGDSKDACKGDGGGPLVCPVRGKPGRFEQVGIVSWGLTCGVYRAPGVYANVALFVDWIDGEMRRNRFDVNIYKRK